MYTRGQAHRVWMRLRDEKYDVAMDHLVVLPGRLAWCVWEYGIVPLHVKIAGDGRS